MGSVNGWCANDMLDLDTILGYADQQMEMNDYDDHSETPHGNDDSCGTNVQVPLDAVREMKHTKFSGKTAVEKLPQQIGRVRPLGQKHFHNLVTTVSGGYSLLPECLCLRWKCRRHTSIIHK